MWNRRLVRCLFFPALLFAAASGCQTFHGYRPTPIEVRDAETKMPIPGVEVKVSYPLETSSFAPSEAKGKTGPDGIARLQAAPCGGAGVMVEVSANGFISEYKYLSLEEVQAIEPAHWFEDVGRRPASFVMEVFANPAPEVELIVPNTYRGQFKAKVQVQADLPASAGQRLFRYEVPESGEVVAAGPPLFRHLTPAHICVRFADNSPLSLMAKESNVGYWLLKVEGTTYHFLVGTQRDYDYYRQSQLSGVPERPRSSGQGGGRRGRKGMPSGDSNP